MIKNIQKAAWVNGRKHWELEPWPWPWPSFLLWGQAFWLFGSALKSLWTVVFTVVEHQTARCSPHFQLDAAAVKQSETPEDGWTGTGATVALKHTWLQPHTLLFSSAWQEITEILPIYSPESKDQGHNYPTPPSWLTPSASAHLLPSITI